MMKSERVVCCDFFFTKIEKETVLLLIFKIEKETVLLLIFRLIVAELRKAGNVFD